MQRYDEVGLSELRRRIGAATETSDNEAALAVAAYTGTGGVTRSRAGSDERVFRAKRF